MAKKFTRVYMFGGLNGKDDPTDYVIGYQCENGKYIDKCYRYSFNSSGYTYSCDGYSFNSLKEAKRYASNF